ncbi:ABC transporter permease [Catenuloplanes indicus JCM 9534]
MAALGVLPSENRIKTELKVGRPKAKAIRAALEQETAPADPEPEQAPEDVVPDPVPAVAEPETVPVPVAEVAPVTVEAIGQREAVVDPVPAAESVTRRAVPSWPVLILALPAFAAVWSGWVGLGEMTGFGVVHPLPGIADGFSLNTAITLPIGVETYAAYALRVWLSAQVSVRVRRFAKWSAIGSLILGALGQVAYHHMEAAGMTEAPWQITTVVACLPVAVLGMGAALAHLNHDGRS